MRAGAADERAGTMSATVNGARAARTPVMAVLAVWAVLAASAPVQAARPNRYNRSAGALRSEHRDHRLLPGRRRRRRRAHGGRSLQPGLRIQRPPTSPARTPLACRPTSGPRSTSCPPWSALTVPPSCGSRRRGIPASCSPSAAATATRPPTGMHPATAPAPRWAAGPCSTWDRCSTSPPGGG